MKVVLFNNDFKIPERLLERFSSDEILQASMIAYDSIADGLIELTSLSHFFQIVEGIIVSKQ